MKIAWDIDDAHEVSLSLNAVTGRIVVVSNGDTVFDKYNMRFRRVIPFQLADGREAEVHMKVIAAFVPEFRLEVEGVPIARRGAAGPVCTRCRARVSSGDEFCEACGARVDPSALFEHAESARQIREATHAILALMALFAISGVVAFGLSSGESNDALATLAEYPGDMLWHEPVNGQEVTVDELRDIVLWEKWSVLVVNLGLSVFMAGLAWWSRRAALTAILTAFSVYVGIQVFNAIIDPATLMQGILVKIIVISVLARGLKAALAARGHLA